MQELLGHPAIQAGIAPLVAALVVGAMLGRSRAAWLAIVAGYAAMVALTTGFSFTPLSASRKVLLLVLLAPLVGVAADIVAGKARPTAAVLGLVGGLVAVWSVSTVLVQRDLGSGVALGGLVFICAGAIVWLTLRLRSDGVALGAAGLGLGLATGIAALLSASTGYFMAGIALAASCGALLLVQLAAGRAISGGFTGALSVGLAAALFASASLLLAKLPWYAFVLMPLIPAAAIPGLARVPALWLRLLLASGATAAVAALPVLAAWYATRL
jgi:hypothetical protein